MQTVGTEVETEVWRGKSNKAKDIGQKPAVQCRSAESTLGSSVESLGEMRTTVTVKDPRHPRPKQPTVNMVKVVLGMGATAV